MRALVLGDGVWFRRATWGTLMFMRYLIYTLLFYPSGQSHSKIQIITIIEQTLVVYPFGDLCFGTESTDTKESVFLVFEASL